MSEDKMMKWAEGEPWNADVSERYYYTMSRMMDQQVRGSLFVEERRGTVRWLQGVYFLRGLFTGRCIRV